MDILLKFSAVCNISFAIGRYRYHRQSTCPTRLDRSEIFFFDDLRGYGTMDVMSRDLVIKVIDMDFFGQPIWVVGLVCLGVFCASFMDAIGGGGGIISLPTYLLAGLALKNGSKIVRPVILVVIVLLAGKVILELFGIG